MGRFIGADVGEVPSKGVRKRGNKWVAEIRNRLLRGGRHPGRKWLGTFSTAAEAREAYARAVRNIVSSQRAPRSVKNLQADGAQTSPSLHSSLSSLSASYTGAKRGPDRVPDVSKRSKRPRSIIRLDNGTGSRSGLRSLRKKKKVPSPLASMCQEDVDHDGIMLTDCESFEQEICKGTVTTRSSTISSSSDSAWSGFGTSQSAERSDDFHNHGTTSDCKELSLGLCFTSFAISDNSTDSDQASACAPASPSSPSATSTWNDEFDEVKNQCFDDSSLETAREKKIVMIDASHGPFESGPATSQELVLTEVGDSASGEVFRSKEDAPGLLTMFFNASTVIDHANVSPVIPGARHSPSDAYQACRSSSLCTDNPKVSPCIACSCFRGQACHLVLDHDRKANVEGLDYFVDNRLARQGESSLLDCEPPYLHLLLNHFSDMKIEDLVAFKTKHLLYELNAEFISEWRSPSSELPQIAELSEKSHSLRWSMEKEYRNTEIPADSVFPSPAPSVVCNHGIPDQEHRVYFMEAQNLFEHSFQSELTEPRSLDLRLDTAYLSDYEGGLASLKESEGLNFVSVDELLEYF